MKDILSMIGGLALFLYGMNFMGSQLEKMSGGKLEKILEKMTDKTYKGVLLGAVVTAIIQSSSAVTVMVVGFVNSGIMQLSRAIGVIMGANIGTTMTSWILSLTGLSGDSVFAILFKPSTFAPIMAVIGVFAIMFSKKEKVKTVGGILTGFAILMMGMNFMSSSMSGLAKDEQFTSILVKFSNPLLGVLVGALLTAVIQSSSASVGILQALAISGSVSYATAFPIILGQNIGTCITALISSVGTSKNAKRAAFAHFYFNVIGVILALALFYGGNAIFKFNFLQDSVSATDIAILHSVFNIFATLILLPFTKQLEWLATKTIRGGKEEKETAKSAEIYKELIDDRFFLSPSYAVDKCKDVTVEMSELVEKTTLCALSVIKDYSEEKAVLIKTNEKATDKFEEILETYLVKISAMDLSDDASKRVFMLHHAIEHFEKMGDYSEDILKARIAINERNYSLSDQAKYELSVMIAALTKTINLTMEAFKNDDYNLAKKIEPLEMVIDGLKKQLKNRHLKRVEAGECSVEHGYIYLEIVNAMERISDHCADLAVSLIELHSGDYNVHSYVREVKKSDKEFIESFDSYLEKYSLS